MKETESTYHNERLLRVRDIVAPNGILNIARSTFYAGIARGIYPPPLKLGARVSVWRKSELMAAVERLTQRPS